jgi:uncharacterized phage protein gp47/JayE
MIVEWGTGLWGEGNWGGVNQNIYGDRRNIIEAEQQWDSAIDFSNKSNTHSLVDALTEEYDRIDQNLTDIYQQTHINSAYGEELDQFGELVDVERKQNESDGKYRARIKATFRASTIGTTYDEFIEFCATALNTDVDGLSFTTDYENKPANITVGAETTIYESSGFTKNEITELLAAGVPAGHEVTVVEGGSFRLKSDGETDDPEAGLTSDTTDEGGTLIGEL